MLVENREWVRVRGDNNCVSADQYALTVSISVVPVRSLDEQPKPKPAANSDFRGVSAVPPPPPMTHGQTENSWRVTDTLAKGEMRHNNCRLAKLLQRFC